MTKIYKPGDVVVLQKPSKDFDFSVFSSAPLWISEMDEYDGKTVTIEKITFYSSNNITIFFIEEDNQLYAYDVEWIKDIGTKQKTAWDITADLCR